jgi:hypothetical protein
MLDMKLLTATSTGQGMRDDDVNDPDGGCGCGRGFSGLSSMRATTTALVRDLPMSREDVADALSSYFELAGYADFVTPGALQDEVDDLLIAGSHWEAGSIVERRVDQLRSRGQLASAESTLDS